MGSKLRTHALQVASGAWCSEWWRLQSATQAEPGVLSPDASVVRAVLGLSIPRCPAHSPVHAIRRRVGTRTGRPQGCGSTREGGCLRSSRTIWPGRRPALRTGTRLWSQRPRSPQICRRCGPQRWDAYIPTPNHTGACARHANPAACLPGELLRAPPTPAPSQGLLPARPPGSPCSGEAPRRGPALQSHAERLSAPGLDAPSSSRKAKEPRGYARAPGVPFAPL